VDSVVYFIQGSILALQRVTEKIIKKLQSGSYQGPAHTEGMVTIKLRCSCVDTY